MDYRRNYGSRRPSQRLFDYQRLDADTRIAEEGVHNNVPIADAKAKVVRKLHATEPTSAAILPSGNILVGSYRASMVVEIDCTGKVVWEVRTPGQVTRVRVR